MLHPYFRTNQIEAGVDEAGRGCLAGPVFAAAVIFPKNYSNHLLNDSKKLTKKSRSALKETIIQHAKSWAIGTASPQEIDEINILNASFLAMHRALDKLHTMPEFILVDGNKFNPYHQIPHQTIVGGDGKYISIAAASILAKTFRDDFMESIHREYPQYQWSNNKGYPTKAHKKAIAECGITNYHRKSFRINEQLKIKF
jgi:ribonuclease HII